MPNLPERRRSVQNMTEAQFRELVMALFDQGAANMAEMRKLIEENTKLTQETHDKTATAVAIMSFSEASASRLVKFARFLSGAAKILIPIFVLYGVVQGLIHGHFPDWKDLI